MNEAQARAVEQMREVLAGTPGLEFKPSGEDNERYGWIEAVLRRILRRLVRTAGSVAQHSVLQRIINHCGKPLRPRFQDQPIKLRWNFSVCIFQTLRSRALQGFRQCALQAWALSGICQQVFSNNARDGRRQVLAPVG